LLKPHSSRDQPTKNAAVACLAWFTEHAFPSHSELLIAALNFLLHLKTTSENATENHALKVQEEHDTITVAFRAE
jgi:hypothetical protein